MLKRWEDKKKGSKAVEEEVGGSKSVEEVGG